MKPKVALLLMLLGLSLAACSHCPSGPSGNDCRTNLQNLHDDETSDDED